MSPRNETGRDEKSSNITIWVPGVYFNKVSLFVNVIKSEWFKHVHLELLLSIFKVFRSISHSFVHWLFWNFNVWLHAPRCCRIMFPFDKIPLHFFIIPFLFKIRCLLFLDGFTFNNDGHSLKDGLVLKLINWNGARHIPTVI